MGAAQRKRRNRKYHPSDVDAAIARRLRYERALRDLTLKDMGDVLGVSPTQVCHFEAGVKHMDQGQLAVVAEFFGIPVDELLDPVFEIPLLTQQNHSIFVRFARMAGTLDDDMQKVVISACQRIVRCSPQEVGLFAKLMAEFRNGRDPGLAAHVAISFLTFAARRAPE
jgi:transcriptional regulator with XRE-family HTH domain